MASSENLPDNKQLTIRFKLQQQRFLLDVDEVIPGRGVTALSGPSAAGKTTLLRCIAGLQQTANGLCTINGDCWQDSQHFTAVHQRPLGYVFQRGNLFEHLSIKQNLEFGFKRITGSHQKVAFNNAVELLGLDTLLERNPVELSGGQQQRVAIARALLTSPKLLLMDEPLANLDYNSKQAILPYLEELHDSLDIPVIYVSHALDEVLRIADHLLYMEGGHIMANDTLNQVLMRNDLPLAYRDEACIVLQGTVFQHHPSDHLSEIKTAAGHFYLSQINANINDPVRVRIAARDVSITLSPATDTSIQHVLPATIMDISPAPDTAKRLLRLRIDKEILLASITARSVTQLQLSVGQAVHAQVKSVALM